MTLNIILCHFVCIFPALHAKHPLAHIRRPSTAFLVRQTLFVICRRFTLHFLNQLTNRYLRETHSHDLLQQLLTIFPHSDPSILACIDPAANHQHFHLKPFFDTRTCMWDRNTGGDNKNPLEQLLAHKSMGSVHTCTAHNADRA